MTFFFLFFFIQFYFLLFTKSESFGCCGLVFFPCKILRKERRNDAVCESVVVEYFGWSFCWSSFRWFFFLSSLGCSFSISLILSIFHPLPLPPSSPSCPPLLLIFVRDGIFVFIRPWTKLAQPLWMGSPFSFSSLLPVPILVF